MCIMYLRALLTYNVDRKYNKSQFIYINLSNTKNSCISEIQIRDSSINRSQEALERQVQTFGVRRTKTAGVILLRGKTSLLKTTRQF